MRIAALVKQIPKFEEMELGPDGRLRREGLELEMNPYCRRAVAKGVALAQETNGTCTAFTLGPPSAEDTLREAIAWGANDGVLITDPAFAGSDTLATARALAAALDREGPFDLILVGRNSVDADTGQVGPETAELLDLPFATGVRYLALTEHGISVRCEHDDGWVQAELPLPALVSTAERLCDPCKVDPEGRAAVAPDRIRTLTAAELGAGPWGQAGSPTRVGAVRVHATDRARQQLEGPLEQQVHDATALLRARGALETQTAPVREPVPAATGPAHINTIAVLVEPARDHLTRELLGAAAQLDATVVALGPEPLDAPRLGTWGADRIVAWRAGEAPTEEDIATALAAWAEAQRPWAILGPSTAWGREVAARAAARLGAGLTGDAVALETVDGRLVAWKPAFGGQLVAAITATSPIQMATVRAGMLPRLEPRATATPPHEVNEIEQRHRVRILARTRDGNLDTLAEATAVVGVGKGVHPNEYDELRPLLDALDAELGATRKVTDEGWLPRACQIGITGRSIAPRLYVALGLGGKFNHMVGVRAAGTVLAINADPDALVFDAADVGIVGDWHEAVPLLVKKLTQLPS